MDNMTKEQKTIMVAENKSVKLAKDVNGLNSQVFSILGGFGDKAFMLETYHDLVELEVKNKGSKNESIQKLVSNIVELEIELMNHILEIGGEQ